jgi:hypothetical protein
MLPLCISDAWQLRGGAASGVRRVARVRAAELPVGGDAMGGAGRNAGALGRLHRAAPAPHPALGEHTTQIIPTAVAGQRSTGPTASAAGGAHPPD